MTEEEKKKEKIKLPHWIAGPVIVFIASLIFMIAIFLLISGAPRVDYESIDSNVVILTGDSGQTVSDSITMLIKPNNNLIDVINVSGFFYENVFNETIGLYEVEELSDEQYSKLFLQVRLNGSEEVYDIGIFKDKSLIVSSFKVPFLPTKNNTEIKFTFTYDFPSVGCSCNSKSCTYIFKPKLRFGFIE